MIAKKKKEKKNKTKIEKNVIKIHDKLLDNKMILKYKENVIRQHYNNLYKSTDKDKINENLFNIKFKRLNGIKLSRKKQKLTSSKTKKI